MPFQSYCGVSASSAAANGGTDTAHSHLLAVLCVYLPASVAYWACLCVRNVCAKVYVGVCVCSPRVQKLEEGWEVYILCRSRFPCFSSSSFVLALPSAVDFLSVLDSHVSVCTSVHCLVLLTFLKSTDC